MERGGMNKKVDQGQSTRQRIVEAATRLFGESGYDGTSIEGVLKATGVSRGALYHHFEGKQALFDAVLEQVQAQLAKEILGQGSRSKDPMESLKAGCLGFLRMSRNPAVRQIMLIDAPSAVGWQRCREIDARHGFGLMKFSLAHAASAGRIDRDLADPYAHIVFASLMELAQLITHAGDPDLELSRAERAITRLIDTL